MAVAATWITVGTSATLLASGDVDGTSVIVRTPSGGVTVYLGGSAVATTDGFALAAGEPLALDLKAGEQLYAVVAASTQVVRTLAAQVNSGSSGYPYS